MLKKLSLVFFTISSLTLLVTNVLSSLKISLGGIFDIVTVILFWGCLLVGASLTLALSVKHGMTSGFFKGTKVIDWLLLGSALFFFAATTLNIDLLVAICYPLIVFFFELHILFNIKEENFINPPKL